MIFKTAKFSAALHAVRPRVTWNVCIHYLIYPDEINLLISVEASRKRCIHHRREKSHKKNAVGYCLQKKVELMKWFQDAALIAFIYRSLFTNALLLSGWIPQRLSDYEITLHGSLELIDTCEGTNRKCGMFKSSVPDEGLGVTITILVFLYKSQLSDSLSSKRIKLRFKKALTGFLFI